MKKRSIWQVYISIGIQSKRLHKEKFSKLQPPPKNRKLIKKTTIKLIKATYQRQRKRQRTKKVQDKHTSTEYLNYSFTP